MNGSFKFDPMTGKPVAQTPQTPTPQTTPAKRKREFSKKEKISAWISVPVGYLFCRTFPVWQKPPVALIFTLSLFAFSLFFFDKQKRKGRCWFYPVSALIFACSLFFANSPVLLFFAFGYICIAFLLFCQTGSDAALEEHAGQLFFFETIKALFVSPFKNTGASFEAISANKSAKNIWKVLLFILAGIGITIVPTLIVTALLSYDSRFIGILEAIRLPFFDLLFTRIQSLIYAVPVGMYIYDALYASAHPTPDNFNTKNCVEIENDMKFAPALVGAVAIVPLLFLYGVFIAAQGDYYKAIFTSTLPEAFTFAEFARDGFFRLCAVSAINALVLIALRVFTKKTNSGKISPVVKIYTVILSIVTIIISVTALSQMTMYVSTYGLTRLRLYTLWFMALLILLFFLTILKQVIEKLPFATAALTLVVLCFGLLAVPDADAFIARYNYNCHLANTTHAFDTEYLGELAPSSIPVLCEIATNKHLPENTRTSALREIGMYASAANHKSNLPAWLADKAYRALGREMQLRAAVACNGFCPPVYLSIQTQAFTGDGTDCDLTIYLYDKNETAVFTDNSCYTSQSNVEITAASIEKYAEMCAAAGEENLLPFSASDLSDTGRFYTAVDGDAPTDGYDAPMYIYDKNNGCLVVLNFSA